MASDNRLLLVKCITLLYREGMIADKTENSADLVRTVLESIKLPELSITLNHEKEYLGALKDTALYMCGNEVNVVYEKEDLLQRLKVNCGHDDKLYDAFVQGIDKEMDEGPLKRTILAIRRYISDSFREEQSIKLFTMTANKLRFERDGIKDLREYYKDFATKLEPYLIETSKKDPAIVSSVDIGDTGSLNEVFEEVKQMDNHTGLLRTGWKGLNDMLQGGFRRGEQWVLPALQHKYKTGMTLSLFRQFAQHNTPVMIDPKKKPLLLRISFEDSILANLQFMYENIYINEHAGEVPNLKDVSPAQMSEYVKEKMQATGYHIKMMRVNPSDWSLRDLQNTILDFEANGYEIHACIVDYLPMLPTTGCEDGPAGHALRDLYRRTRNFFSARKILLITPHQLSTDAKQLIRDGRSDFVKELPGKGYFSGSKQIDQEVDGELYQHIETLNGRAYLTMQRGKHRGVGIIPDELHYMVLPFPEKGSIPDDLLSERPIHSRKIGGGAVGSGEETPFWSYV